MVQATNFGNLHDLPDLGPLDWPPTRRIFLEGKVSSCAVIVREVGSQQAAQVAFAQDENVIETLAPDRADEPFCEGFCHGLWGAVNTSRMRGAESSGKASTSCWVVQAAVGCSVTLKWTTRRRWWASTTRTKRTRSWAAGTVKKSIATKSRT